MPITYDSLRYSCPGPLASFSLQRDGVGRKSWQHPPHVFDEAIETFMIQWREQPGLKERYLIAKGKIRHRASSTSEQASRDGGTIFSDFLPNVSVARYLCSLESTAFTDHHRYDGKIRRQGYVEYLVVASIAALGQFTIQLFARVTRNRVTNESMWQQCRLVKDLYLRLHAYTPTDANVSTSVSF